MYLFHHSEHLQAVLKHIQTLLGEPSGEVGVPKRCKRLDVKKDDSHPTLQLLPGAQRVGEP